MEHRNFDAVNPLDKWLGKDRKFQKLQELRMRHRFIYQLNPIAEQNLIIPEIPESHTKNPTKIEKSEERLIDAVRSWQKREITDGFIHHSQPAKKVYDWLTPFFDSYQRYQDDLKGPDDLSMGQLQTMHSDIQTSLKKVEDSLTSDQQLPEAAKQNTKAFLDNHLAGMNAQIDKLKKLKTDKDFPYSETTLAYMDYLQEKFAKFAEKLGQTGNTTLDQLKENLTDLSSEIEKLEIKVKNEIDEIKFLIESTYKVFKEANNDRKFAFKDTVKDAFEHLTNIRLYTNQEREITTRGLMEKRQVLRTANALLDELIETRIREEVDKWSYQVMDVKCIQPGPRMYRNFEIASVLDTPAFEQVAKDFDKALKQRAPEDIYRVLLSLQREPEAINSLDNAYRGGTNGKTLETALNERFGEPEDQARLEYALQLINQGKVEAEQAIKQEHFKAAVQRIHQALYPNSGNPKIEVAYAALTPFTRNTELLCSLDTNYNSNFKTGLKSDIEHTLQGDPKAKDYALFLIGDQVLEKKVRSWSEAVRLQKALLKQTFRRDDGIHIPVPYDYLLQDSANWTHIICQALKEGGYESKKIVALSLRIDENEEKLPNLHVYTDLAPDMPDGKDPIVTSMYRMAPLIQVEASFGMVELVLDPGLSPKPLTIKQWMGKMSQDSFEHISLDAYKTKQIDEYQKNPADSYPADQTYVFTGSRNIPTLPFSPYTIDNLLREKPIPDQDTSQYYKSAGKAAMNDGTAWIPYYRMARSIRENMQSINDDLFADHFLNTIAKNFLKDVNTFHSISSSTNFSSAFPNLYKDLRTYLANTDVSAPIVKHFEKLLSGKHAPSGANGDQSALPADSVYDVGTNLPMLEYQATDTGAIKDTEDRIENLQQEVDRWPLEKIHIERIQQRPIFFRDCKLADVLDFRQLADDFHDALKPGKLPEDLYRVLQALQREPEAINKLDNAYEKKYHKTLETALNERFGKSEDSAQQEYALQLINKGNPEAEQVIEPLLANPSQDEFDQVAKRIHLALTRLNPQPEVVYAALTPFERNTELLCKLNASYQQLSGIDKTLQSQIRDKLKDQAKDYALFLIGDQAMEKKEISHYEAMRLWKVVERLTFDQGYGVRTPVPYDSPSEGCHYRTHIMAQALKEMGYASEKIFVLSLRSNEIGQKLNDLYILTDLAPDMSHDRTPTVIWWYHVAPCIQIKTETGSKELLVLDPSLSSEPLTTKNWMSKIGKASYASITFEEFKSKMKKERQVNPQDSNYYPADQAYIFTTSRNYGDLPGLEDIESVSKNTLIPDQYGSEYYDREGKEFMINGVKWVPYNRMARSIREELRNPTIQNAKDADAFLNKLATNFLADVSEYRSSTSNAFSNAFPNLYNDLIAYVQTRIDHLSDNSSLERFREHLSGESRFH